MSLKSIVGQHMFIGIQGHTLTADEKSFIVENDIGGICLFGRNVAEPKQVYELCAEIQNLSKKTVSKSPLFISIDMEGGRVHRLKKPFTIWPPLKHLGDLDNPTASYQFAYRMGQELLAVGINLDFAPCVDVFSNPQNTVIGDRSISSNPELVAKHASALVRGYIKSGVISCAKHFPGHGNTIADSHYDLPKETSTWEELREFEVIPFNKTFKSRVDMVMTSHILFENIDPDWPVTLSEKFIQDYLRNELKYRGLIITDDLGMKAMTDNYGIEEVPVQALRAGVDLLLYCNDFEVPPIAHESIMSAVVLGSLQEERLMESYKHIQEIKAQKLSNPMPLSLQEALAYVGNSDNLRLAEAIKNGEVSEDLLVE